MKHTVTTISDVGLSDRFGTADTGDLSFSALWRVVWKYKVIVASAALVCGGIAAYLALTATWMYRAEVTVAEVSPNAAGGGGLANQLGGIANLVGITIGNNSGVQQNQGLLRSRRLIEEFVKTHNQLPELFQNSKEPPTLWLTVRKFKDSILSIRDDKRAGLTIIAITWKDPAVAARWANEFVALANELLRERAMNESKASLTYLNRQVDTTNVIDLRRVLYNLIENEEKTLMLANARTEYAFAVVDPAVAPEERYSPRRALMVLFGLAVGTFIGTLVAFMLNSRAERRDVAAEMARQHTVSNVDSAGHRYV